MKLKCERIPEAHAACFLLLLSCPSFLQTESLEHAMFIIAEKPIVTSQLRLVHCIFPICHSAGFIRETAVPLHIVFQVKYISQSSI